MTSARPAKIRTTSERVAWTQTHNIGVSDPELAGRIMAATAKDQDRLKREAGIKNTGRKSPNSVYAYSVAWHPEEAGKLDREQMLEGARESLRAIGAEDHQAIFVAHNDAPHPHVHVIVNRVSPIDGRMLSTSNDYKKLEAWALAYRQQRGEEQKYCPARIRKAEAAAASKRGEKVAFVRGDRPISRAMANDYASARADNPHSARSTAERQRPLNAEMMKKTAAMKAQHARQWAELSKGYQQKKAEIRSQAAAAEARAKAAVNRQFEGPRRTLAAEQFAERQAFEKREATIGGKIKNVMEAIKHRKASTFGDEDKGWSAAAFNFITSQRARADALAKLHRAQGRQLSAAEQREIGAAIAAVRSDKTALLSSARSGFNADRTALIERQSGERDTIKRGWLARRREQSRVFDTVRRDAAAKRASSARQRPSSEMKREETKAAHQAAAEGRKRSTGRSRIRKRSRGDG